MAFVIVHFTVNSSKTSKDLVYIHITVIEDVQIYISFNGSVPHCTLTAHETYGRFSA